jgi:hypothetical protein
VPSAPSNQSYTAVDVPATHHDLGSSFALDGRRDTPHSLVHLDQRMEPDYPDWLIACPDGNGWTRRSKFGELIPDRCTCLDCPVCAPIEARRVGRAIALARPERLVGLTLVGLDWEDIHQRFKKFMRVLGILVEPGKWAWGVQPNPLGTGNHIHAYQYGPAFEPWDLAEAAAQAGMGREVDITDIDNLEGVRDYLVRDVRDSDKRASDLSDQAQEYLRLNGGRLVHSSRGFFRDLAGNSLTLAEAKRISSRPQGRPGSL